MVDCWLLVAIYCSIILPFPILPLSHLWKPSFNIHHPVRWPEKARWWRFAADKIHEHQEGNAMEKIHHLAILPCHFLPPIWLGMVAIGSHTTNQKMLGDSKHDIVLPTEIEPTWCETSNGETHDYTWIHWFAGYKRLNILDGRDSTNNLLTTLK